MFISSISPLEEVDEFGDFNDVFIWEWWGKLGWWRMVVGGRMGEGCAIDCGEGGDSSLGWWDKGGDGCGTGEIVWGDTEAMPLRLGL